MLSGPGCCHSSFFFVFSPTDLHLYITVTGRVPSLNAPSISPRLLSRPLSLILSSTRTRTSWKFSHSLRHSRFRPLLVSNPTDTTSPHPPFPSIVLIKEARHAWLSRSSSDRVRRVSLPLATRGDLKEATLFSFLLTYFTY